MFAKMNLKISDFKNNEKYKTNSWFQWMCIFVETLPLFTYGLQTAWIQPIQGPQHHQRIPVSAEVLPWELPALYLSAAVASPGVSWLCDRIGRRKSVIYITIIHLISWILLLFKNDITFITSRIYSGVSSSGILIIIISYITEICEMKQRGMVIVFATFMLGCGYFVTHLMILLLNYLSVIYLAFSVILLNFLMSFSVPESPSFLVKSGKFEEATKVISELTLSDVKSEVVIQKLENFKNERENSRCPGNIVITIFRSHIYRNALKIGIILQSIRVFGGSHYIINCASDVFNRSQMYLHPYVKTLVVPAILVLGCFIALIFVDKIGRKILLTASSIIMTLSFGILGVFMQTELTVTSLNWLPLTVLMTATLGYGIGFFAVPFVVMTEVLNFEIRATVLSIIFIYTWIITFIQSYTYKYVEDYMGSDTVIYIYSGISIYGAVYSVFSPQTNNKSIEEIEHELKKNPILKL